MIQKPLFNIRSTSVVFSKFTGYSSSVVFWQFLALVVGPGNEKTSKSCQTICEGQVHRYGYNLTTSLALSPLQRWQQGSKNVYGKAQLTVIIFSSINKQIVETYAYKLVKKPTLKTFFWTSNLKTIESEILWVWHQLTLCISKSKRKVLWSVSFLIIALALAQTWVSSYTYYSPFLQYQKHLRSDYCIDCTLCLNFPDFAKITLNNFCKFHWSYYCKGSSS